MASSSKIEWTDATWNPIRGCSRVSEGCRNCYAEVMAARFSGPDQWGEGLARMVKTADGATDHRWTGRVEAAPDAVLDAPLRWKKPRRIFVNSTSDLFHEKLPDALIDQVFAVMALCPQHTFQILTKRPERMRRYLAKQPLARRRWEDVIRSRFERWTVSPNVVPQNVWLGVSIEDHATAETRIPYLLETPAARRFVSAEPLLGPVDFAAITMSPHLTCIPGAVSCLGGIDWVIVGGESGPGARPMHPQWARQIRDDCAAVGTGFTFKQWGAWLPSSHCADLDAVGECHLGEFHDGGDWVLGCICRDGDPDMPMFLVGKGKAGRLLDGVLHDWTPETAVEGGVS
ncbi:phage Gp37/Gp68 family protein [Roseibium sp.]